jgi:hypothetical protein
LVLTAINELSGYLPLNVSVSVIGDADASWLGNAFKPSCYVHAIAKDIFGLNEHVAQVNADAKQHSPVLPHISVPICH